MSLPSLDHTYYAKPRALYDEHFAPDHGLPRHEKPRANRNLLRASTLDRFHDSLAFLRRQGSGVQIRWGLIRDPARVVLSRVGGFASSGLHLRRPREYSEQCISSDSLDDTYVNMDRAHVRVCMGDEAPAIKAGISTVIAVAPTSLWCRGGLERTASYRHPSRHRGWAGSFFGSEGPGYCRPLGILLGILAFAYLFEGVLIYHEHEHALDNSNVSVPLGLARFPLPVELDPHSYHNSEEVERGVDGSTASTRMVMAKIR
ncbi:hypothetical protein EDB84DRAFT_1444824, partial [Lactarius hengduanensis]